MFPCRLLSMETQGIKAGIRQLQNAFPEGFSPSQPLLKNFRLNSFHIFFSIRIFLYFWGNRTKRLTMRAELHTWNRLSCPSGSGNFFIWLFSCLSLMDLIIFNTRNLYIRKGLLSPPEIRYVSISYAEALHRCARRHTKHFCARMPLVLFLCPDNTTYKSVNHQKRG